MVCSAASSNAGKPCTVVGDCPGGACLTPNQVCAERDGNQLCTGTDTCDMATGLCEHTGNPCGPGGLCYERTCTSGQACLVDTDCTLGTCIVRATAGCHFGRCCASSGGGEFACSVTRYQTAPNGLPGERCPTGSAWFNSGDLVSGQVDCPGCPKYASGIADNELVCIGGDDDGETCASGATCDTGRCDRNFGPITVVVGPASQSTCADVFSIGDDYTFSNEALPTNDYLEVNQLVFIGGVETVAEERISFEFYDGTVLIEDVFFPSGSGIAVRTIVIDPPIILPPTGRVIARAATLFAPSARVFWAATNEVDDVNGAAAGGEVGANNAASMYVDLTDNNMHDPTFINYARVCVGGTNNDAFCDANVDCGACAGGVNLGGPCDADVDCPGSTCDEGVCTDVPDILAFELTGEKVPPPPQCSQCGPGAHWIDLPPCPGPGPGGTGEDMFDSEALVGIDLDLDCKADTNLQLNGPVRVAKIGPLDDSGQFPGSAVMDGHLDVIDTEIISMTLFGGGVQLTAGAGLGASPISPTLGTIVEQPADPARADSFFDVFFEVAIPGMFLYNQQPLRIQAEITCVPPDVDYLHPITCLPLYESPVPGQGERVFNLVTARHTPFPNCFPDCGKDNIECLNPGPEFDARRPVGRLLISGGLEGTCTAWIIGSPNCIITNRHCITDDGSPFGAIDDVTTRSIEFNYECDRCTLGQLKQPTDIYPVIELIHENPTLDYALLKVSGNPGAIWGQLSVDPAEAVLNEEIYEIHHGGGLKKGIDEGTVTSIDVPGTCIPGTTAEIGISAIASGGASGSPVLRRSNHAVTALCHCGPDCQPGFAVPMSHILPDAFNHLLDAACNVNGFGPTPEPGGDDLCQGGPQNGQACSNAAACPGGLCATKNRYMSITAPGTAVAGGTPQALQVTVANCPQFPAIVGDVWWAGPPQTIPNPPPLGNTVIASELECTTTPHMQVWNGTTYCFGRAIVPNATYLVRFCDSVSGPCYPPLFIETINECGDVIPPFGGASQPNFADVAAIVDSFIGRPTAPPLVRTDLVPKTPNHVANFSDINAAVGCFQGLSLNINLNEPEDRCPAE